MATSRTQHLDEGGGGGGGRIVDELPLELQPKFTEQDERRELATLTIQELWELQSDLTGIRAITSGFSGLGLGGDANTGEINVYGGESTVGPPAPLPMNDYLRLDALEQHMRALPAQSTEAYFAATAKCPDMRKE